MTNHIENLQIVTRRLTPTEAELHIHVRPAKVDSTTEVRGRLLGPRCLFSTTIEIAYALRKLTVTDTELIFRVIIPEPNWWHPQAPFLYEGPLELWHNGARCDQREIRTGLRSMQWDAGGLRWNGRPLELRGKRVAKLDKEMAALLREQGYNAILALHQECEETLQNANRYGLLVFWSEMSGDVQQITSANHANHPAWFGAIHATFSKSNISNSCDTTDGRLRL